MSDGTGETIRLVFEGLAAAGVIGTGIVALLRLGAIGEKIMHHGEKLEKMDAQLDRQDQTLSTLAVQKEEIRSIRDALTQSIARTDETFKRIFNRLDRNTQ